MKRSQQAFDLGERSGIVLQMKIIEQRRSCFCVLESCLGPDVKILRSRSICSIEVLRSQLAEFDGMLSLFLGIVRGRIFLVWDLARVGVCFKAMASRRFAR